MSTRANLSVVALLVASFAFAPSVYAQAGAVVDGAGGAAADVAAEASTSVSSDLSADVEAALSAHADLSAVSGTSTFETVRTSTGLTANADIEAFASTRSNNAEAIAELQTSIRANAELTAALEAQDIDIEDVVAIQVGANGTVRVIVDDRDTTAVAARSTLQSQTCDDATADAVIASSTGFDMDMLGSVENASIVQLESCDVSAFAAASGLSDLRGTITGNAALEGTLKAGGFTQSDVVGVGMSGDTVLIYVIDSPNV